MTATGKDVANAPEVKILSDQIESLQRENEGLRENCARMAAFIAPDWTEDQLSSHTVEQIIDWGLQRRQAAEAQVKRLRNKVAAAPAAKQEAET